MQPAASHPLSADRAHRHTRISRSGPILALPDARDDRYPRALPWRAVRLLPSAWWLLLAAYLSYGATALLLADPSAGTTGRLTALARAYGLEGLATLAGGTLWLPAVLALPSLALLVGGILAQRWAARDTTREAMVLLLREVSATEQANSSWMRHALLPALEWRVQCVRRRRLLLGGTLILGALLLGALLAVLFAGPAEMLVAGLGM